MKTQAWSLASSTKPKRKEDRRTQEERVTQKEREKEKETPDEERKRKPRSGLRKAPAFH
jgi:ribosomal protein L12E/L44/L45/RPP1/RPP2